MSHVKKELVSLGTLGLQEQFQFPGKETIFKTITYPESFVNHNKGSRYCLNMSTLRAEVLACREQVIPKFS